MKQRQQQQPRGRSVGNKWLPYSLVTINAGGWNQTKAMIETFEFDVCCVQEHKMVDLECLEDRVQAWSRRGVKVIVEPAFKTDKGASSCGVLIAAQQGASLHKVDIKWVGKHWHGRAVLGVLALPGREKMLVASLYLQVGVGWSQCNMELVASVIATSELANMKLLIGADFNMTPEGVWSAGLLQQARMQLLVPTQPTCITRVSSSTIDFWACSQDLVHLIKKVAVHSKLLCPPHRAVELHMMGPLQHPFKHVLTLCKKLPVAVLLGPQQQRGTSHIALGAEAALQLAMLAGSIQDIQDESLQAKLDQWWAKAAPWLWKETMLVTGTWDGGKQRPGKQLKVVMVPVCPSNRPSQAWRTQGKPYRWLLQRATHLQYLLDVGKGHHTNLHQAELHDVAEELAQCPFDLDVMQETTRAALMKAAHDMAFGSEQEVCLREVANSIDYFMAELQRLKTKADNVDRSTSEQRWQHWVAEALGGHAAAAHRWTRQPTCMEEGLAVGLVAQWNLTPQEKLAQEVTKLQGLWATSSRQLEHVPCRHQHIELITKEEILKASRSFSSRAAHSHEGFHPKHWGILNDDCVQMVQLLLLIFESSSRMPACLQQIQTFLIAKPKGGLRPINLFSSVYRLWVRFRRPVARSWEQANWRAFLSFSAGSGPIQAVGRQAILAERDHHLGHASAGIFWDLKQFYEHVCRSKLRKRLVMLGFPAYIMEAALWTYAQNRVVSFMGCGQAAGYSSRGVPAGCGLATTLIMAYAIPSLDSILGRWAENGLQLQLHVYIDDFTILASGPSQRKVVEDILEGAGELLEAIQTDLSCTVSPEKAQVVGSSIAVTKALTRGIHGLAGSAAAAACNLGIDFFAGKAAVFGKHTKRAERWRAFRKRVKRSKRLARAGGLAARKVFNAGVLKSLTYGAELFGLCLKEQSLLVKAAAAHMGLRQVGLSWLKVHQLLDDSVIKVIISPLVFWHREVWSTLNAGSSQAFALPLSTLAQAWRAVATGGAKRAGVIRGPTAAAMKVANQLNWAWSSPFVLSTKEGDLALCVHSPKMVQAKAILAFREQCLADYSEKHGWCYSRLTMQHVSKACKQNQGEDSLSNIEVKCAKIWAAGGWWDPWTMFSRGLPNQDGTCKLCGGVKADVHHIAFLCPFTLHIREHFGNNRVQSILEYLSIDTAGADLLYRGLLPHPSSYGPAPAQAPVIKFWDSQGSAEIQAHHFCRGTIFIDGSSASWAAGLVQKASWAAIEVDDLSGEVLCSLQGACDPILFQTASSAEFAAAAEVAQHVKGVATIYSDCKNLVCELGGDKAEWCKSFHAGLVRKFMGGAIKNSAKISTKWVRAHNGHNECRGWQDSHRFLSEGNAEADKRAKLALGFHPSWSRDDVECVKQLMELGISFVRLVGRSLAFFATHANAVCSPKPHKTRAVSKVGGSRVGSGGGGKVAHMWMWTGAAWQCLTCRSIVKHIGRGKGLESCCGFSDAIRGILMRVDQPHLLYWSSFREGADFVVICRRCGAWTSGKPRLLTLPCQGVGSAKLNDGLIRVLRGKHPKHDLDLGPLKRLEGIVMMPSVGVAD